MRAERGELELSGQKEIEELKEQVAAKEKELKAVKSERLRDFLSFWLNMPLPFFSCCPNLLTASICIFFVCFVLLSYFLTSFDRKCSMLTALESDLTSAEEQLVGAVKRAKEAEIARKSAEERAQKAEQMAGMSSISIVSSSAQRKQRLLSTPEGPWARHLFRSFSLNFICASE